LGVIVFTDKATPLLKGEEWMTGAFFLLLKLKAKAGDLVFALAFFLGFFRSWLKVGIISSKVRPWIFKKVEP